MIINFASVYERDLEGQAWPWVSMRALEKGIRLFTNKNKSRNTTTTM